METATKEMTRGKTDDEDEFDDLDEGKKIGEEKGKLNGESDTIVIFVVLGIVCLSSLASLLCVFFGLFFVKKERRKKRRSHMREEMSGKERQRSLRRRSKQMRRKSMNSASRITQSENVYDSIPKMEEEVAEGEGVYKPIGKVKLPGNEYGLGSLGVEREGVYERMDRVKGRDDEYGFGSFEAGEEGNYIQLELS